MSDDLEVNVVFEGNADELAAQLAAAIERGVGRAIREIQSDMAQIFAGSQQRRAASQAAQGADRTAESWERVRRNIKDADSTLDQFIATLRGLRGSPFFDQIETTATEARGDVQRLRAEIDRIAEDPELGVHFREIARLSQRAFEEVGRNARDAAVTERTEFRKVSEQRRVSDQGATTRARAEASERIVLAQQEGARIVAETRSAGQRRIEIMRFVFNQIRALERGLTGVIRGTANALGATVRGVGASLSRIGGLFRRADAQMAGGLAPALGRREGILRSSMNRQERIIQSSVNTQSLQIQRLERRLSTGVLGAATGRSGLGALLGGGLAIGGGFALISGLRNMIGAAQDFERGLAVLDAQLQLTDRQMERIRETAIDLGNDISLPGVSAVDAAEAINLLVKQFGGLGKRAVPAAQNAAKGVLQLARATQSSAEESAQVVGAAINVFGINANKAVNVADQVTGALTKAAGVGFNDFALAFKQGATVFAQFQVPAVGANEALIDFNTTLAVLARGGLVGSDAGTSLKQFFLQANRGTKDSVKNLKALTERAGETGTAFFDAAGKARPLSEALDIMRRGLRGLSDQERNKTLQKIFGSDAIRAANILLGTSQKTFETVEEGVRRAGIAAEIAAAQNTGLRGAMDALRSVAETQIVLVWRPLNRILGNVVLAFANFFNLVLTADEGPFAIIRDGLKGIALGLGAVLAVKTGVEVIKLLGTVLPALLTPMGLIAAAAATLGAAFFILRDRVPAFKNAIDDISAAFSGLGGGALEFIQEQFNNVVGFLTDTILPKLAEFATTAVQFVADVFTGSDVSDAWARGMEGIDTRTLGEKVGDKIRDIFGVARDVIGNAQELLGDLFFGIDPADELARAMQAGDTRSKFERIGGQIRGVFELMASGVATAFRAIVNAVKAFWRVVEPIVRPAIDGFHQLGDSLRGLVENINLGTLARIGGTIAAAFAGFAVGGPVGGAVAGAAAAIALLFGDTLGAGLLETLGNIGGVIRDALRTALDAITGFFTADRLEGMARGFLDVLEQIAFTIANIATDPRVIAAVAALGALGATMAFRIAEGFARGIIDNFGEMFDIIANALGFEGEFEGLGRTLGNALVIGLLGIFVGGKLLTGLTVAAERLGLSTGRAFSTALQKGVTTVGGTGLGAGPKGLLQGLLGGPQMEAAIQRDVRRITGSIETEIRRMQNVIRGSGRLDLLRSVTPDAAGLRDVRRAFREVEGQIGSARAAGVGFRESLKAFGRAAVFRDVRGVGQAFGDMRASLTGQGRNIGTAVGVAVAGAIGISFGTQMLAEADGMGDAVIGAMTIIASGAAAFAAGGPILGGITVGLGVITSFFQAHQREAQKAKEEVEEYRDALLETSLAARRQRTRDTIFANFQDESTEAKAQLKDLGFTVSGFADELEKGAGAGERFFASLIEGTGPQGAAIAEFLRSGATSLRDLEAGLEGGVAEGAMKILIEQMEAAGINTDYLAAAIDVLQDESGEYAAAAEIAAIETAVLDEGVRNLTRNTGDAKDQMHLAFGVAPTDNVSPVVEGLMTQIGTAKEETVDLREEIDRLFGRRLPTTLQDAMDELIIGLQDLPSTLRGIRLDTALGQAQVRQAASDKSQEFLDAIAEGIESGEITALPQIRVQRRLFLQQVRAAFEGADSAGGRRVTRVEAEVLAQIRTTIDGRQANRNFRQLLRSMGITGTVRPPVNVLPQWKIAQNLGRAGGDLMTQIKEAVAPRRRGPQGFTGGGGGEAIPVPVEIEPEITVRGTQGGIGTGITEAIAAGIEAGGPRINQALNSAIGRALRSGASLAGTFAVAGASAVSAFAQGLTSASGLAVRAATTVGTQATQGAAAGSVGMVIAGGAAATAFAGGVASGSGAAASAGAALASGADAGASGISLYDEGQNAAIGFALGVASGTGSAYRAGYALGQAAEQGTRDALASQSPSKVFRAIGRDIGAGLALGLKDSKADISSAVSEAINNAIEEARRAIPDDLVAMAEAGAGLFEILLPSSIPGGPTEVDVDQARSDALDAIRAVGDAVREATRTNAEIEKAIKEQERTLTEALKQVRERLAEAIQNAFGRGARGLDVARQRINLGGLRGQVAGGLADLLTNVDERIAELRKRANDESLSEEQRARAREQLAAAEARRRQLREQIRNLNINTAAGRAAANVILDFGQQIRDLGSTMLAQGASAEQVSDTMKRYRDQLIQAAIAQGVSRERLREMIQQLGLTDAQLARFVRTSGRAEDNAEERERILRERTQTRIADLRAEILANITSSRSLSQATAAGRQNRRVFIDAFQNIRRFGVELLRSGTSAEDAVAQMRIMRNNLVRNATAMGFNSTEIQELLRMLGLTDAQLAEFVAQLGDLNDELERGRQNTELPSGRSGPFIPTQQNIFNLDLPFGDPEAVAFTVANRIAFAGAG